MKSFRSIAVLTIAIALLAIFAASLGIFSSGGPGPEEFTSVHGQKVMLYGYGIYKNMSADVAPQGIGHDVVTLIIGVPLLLLSLFYSRRDGIKGKILFTGTLGYFMVTYTFYMLMGMYNQLFIVYVLLSGLSFYAFLTSLLSFKLTDFRSNFSYNIPVKFVGGFLIFNSVVIAFLWLSIVIPPILLKEIPIEVAHYTTLVVQGLDLAILLPAGFIAGIGFIKRNNLGFLLASVYLVFLSLLTTALTAKIIAMGITGANIFPSIILIPAFKILAILCVFLIFKKVKKDFKEHSLIKKSQEEFYIK